MEKLKPCPFCGAECDVTEKLVDLSYKIVGNHDVECPFFAMLWEGGYESEDEAIEAWNRRAKDE